MRRLGRLWGHNARQPAAPIHAHADPAVPVTTVPRSQPSEIPVLAEEASFSVDRLISAASMQGGQRTQCAAGSQEPQPDRNARSHGPQSHPLDLTASLLSTLSRIVAEEPAPERNDGATAQAGVSSSQGAAIEAARAGAQGGAIGGEQQRAVNQALLAELTHFQFSAPRESECVDWALIAGLVVCGLVRKAAPLSREQCDCKLVHHLHKALSCMRHIVTCA